MGTNIIIGFAVVTLVGGIFAFMASKTWKIVDVIFLFLIFWAGFFYLTLSVRVWNMRADYLKQAETLRPQLARALNENKALEHGVNKELGQQIPQIEGVEESLLELGLVKLRPQVNRLTQDRGRVWKDCDHAIQNGQIMVAVPSPQPHSIPEKKILFVFEQGPFEKGARYLGEFQVTQTGKGQIALAPVEQMTPSEQQRVVQSQGKWRLYESVPVDQHALLTSLPAKVIQRVFPPATVQEYLKDGKPASADDPDDRKRWFNPDGTLATANNRQEGAVLRYVRQLRDYHMRFGNLKDSRSFNADAIASLESDIESHQASLKSAREDLVSRLQEKASRQLDADNFAKERDYVGAFLSALTKQHEKIEAQRSQRIRENSRLAQNLTQRELDAIRRIDQATGGPVDSVSGR